MTYNVIAPHTVDEHVRSIIQNLPSGVALENKVNESSNIYKFWEAVAQTFVQFEGDINDLYRELSPSLTEQLIDLWEKQYGIPDEIFPGTGTIEERRRDITAKVAANGLQTRQDFEDYFEFIGYDVDIIGNGNEEGIYAWDWNWGVEGVHPWSTDSTELNRFLIVVRFNEQYDDLDTLQMYMQTLIPANCEIIFIKESD